MEIRTLRFEIAKPESSLLEDSGKPAIIFNHYSKSRPERGHNYFPYAWRLLKISETSEVTGSRSPKFASVPLSRPGNRKNSDQKKESK